MLFGVLPGPAPLAARAIGSYARGCLAGGVSLPINGPDWQVMRLSRDRNWGHPRLVDFLERFAADARALITGLDFLSAICLNRAAGQWSPVIRAIRSGLTWIFGLRRCLIGFSRPQERENMTAMSMLKDPFTVDPDKWTPLHTKLIKRAASYPEVDRIFVHPAIKKVLCEQAGKDRRWLAKVRPWWNHYYHFHVSVTCPPGAATVKVKSPVSNDDGCGQELTNWYEKLKRAAIAGAVQPPAGRPSRASLPHDGEASAGVQHSARRWRLRASACQCRTPCPNHRS